MTKFKPIYLIQDFSTLLFWDCCSNLASVFFVPVIYNFSSKKLGDPLHSCAAAACQPDKCLHLKSWLESYQHRFAMIVDGNRLNWSSEYFIVTTYNTSTTKTRLSNMKIHLMKCVWLMTTCLYYISFKIKICLDFDTNMSRVNDILTDDILQSFGLKCCKYEALKSKISHWEFNISFTWFTTCGGVKMKDIYSNNCFIFVLDF